MSGEEKSTELSVIIPTYNEAENIPVLLRRLRRALESSSVGDKYEVIIVDDSSPDGTAKVAEETAKKESIEDKVRVIVRPGRLGLSTAVLEGVKLARGKYLVVMDADLQHPPEKVPEIYSRLVDGADLVIGSRRNRLSSMGLPRAILSLAAELMARLLVPEVRGVRDPMSGFFGFRRGVLGENGPRPRGFKILLHLLARGRYRGGGIVEVEYEFARRHAGKSKLGVDEIISFAIYILELNEYRALKFALVGLSGVLVNEGVLWLLHAVLGLPLYLSGALSIELSVLNNFTWNSLFTFRRVEASGGVVARLFKYHLAVAAGLAVNYSLLLLFSLLLGLNPLLSNLVGIAAGFLANYALSERYVWRRVAAVEGGVEC